MIYSVKIVLNKLEVYYSMVYLYNPVVNSFKLEVGGLLGGD